MREIRNASISVRRILVCLVDRVFVPVWGSTGDLNSSMYY